MFKKMETKSFIGVELWWDEVRVDESFHAGKPEVKNCCVKCVCVYRMLHLRSIYNVYYIYVYIYLIPMLTRSVG
jgi:hypothetical protein